MITATIKRFYTGDSGILYCEYSIQDDQDISFAQNSRIQIDPLNPQSDITKQLSVIVDQANVTQSLKPLVGAIVTSQNPAPVPVPKPTGPLDVQAKP